MSESAWPEAPKLAWRIFRPAWARRMSPANGTVAAPTAMCCRNVRRLTADGILRQPPGAGSHGVERREEQDEPVDGQAHREPDDSEDRLGDGGEPAFGIDAA